MLKILLCGVGSFFIILKFSSATDPLSTFTSTGLKEPHFKERQRFESLLAAGRTLAFPYTTGLILSAISSQSDENWNVSLQGMKGILDLSRDQLLTAYTESGNLLKQDDHVKSCGSLYLLQNWKGNLTSTSVDALDKLQIAVKRVNWEKETANATWELMNAEVKEKTNNLLDGKLIPKDSEIGNPFRFTTQALLVSTFHYKNYWKKPWASGGLRPFGSEIPRNVPFLQAEGEFLFSDAEEYSAISIPLEGEEKSVVFILPKINLTQYLKQSASTRSKKVWSGRVKAGAGEPDADEENGEGDFVPIPTRWEKRDLSIHIPSFSLTVADQYGKELEELGMNETFCTTIRDRRGAIPFYLRPIVQLNTVTLSDIKVEIASASGTALEKFYFGTDLFGIGYPKSGAVPEKTEGKSTESLKLPEKSESQQHPGDETGVNAISGGLKNLDLTLNEEEENTSTFSSGTTISPENDTGSRDKFIFNKPFLWYLNDDKLGPLVYGIVEQTEAVDMDNGETPEENSKFSEEMQRYLMWSCRSFKQYEEIDGSVI